MHDRPVFGGNASSECRVHICGADIHNHFKNMRETGILEELRMENLYRNPNRNFSIGDTILYEKVMAEPNIIPLLNCSCLKAEMSGKAIRAVTGWQLTTQTYHKVKAQLFADCSGDAILAPLTGADFWMGREARDEYGESIAPPKVMPKAFRIEALTGGQWQVIAHVDRNHQRFCCFPVKLNLSGIRFVLEETWGAEQSRIYAFFAD